VQSVLVADDEPHLRLLVRASIASDAYAVLEAADGDESWELIEQYHPAVAVLDVRMPGLTGIELTRKIRAHPQLKGMRVVLLAGSAREAGDAAGRGEGEGVYIPRRFSPLERLEVVERALHVA